MNLFIFLIIVFFLYLMSIVGKKNDIRLKILFILISGVLIIYAGFRPVLSNDDNLAYVDYYEKIPNLKYFFDYDNEVFEKGYMFINMFLKTLNLDYRCLFLFIAMISVSLMMYSIYNYTQNIYTALFIYFSNIFIINELITIRTGIASAILFYSLKYLKKNQKKYLLLVLFSCLFHRTAILGLIPLVMIKLKLFKKKRYIIILILLAFILGRMNIINFIYFSFKNLLPQKISFYFEHYQYTKSSYRRAILTLPLIIYFTLNINKYREKKFFIEGYSFVFTSLLSTLFFINHDAFNRLSFIFFSGIILLNDIYIDTITKIRNRIFIKLLISTICLFLLYWTLRGEYLIKFNW